MLRRHVKQLADKAYWDGMESAPDFVVLFLPGEHLYGAALDADPALIEDAMARRVLIATPTTLLALLHSVGYGWQQERVAESAQAISDLGRELHGSALAKLSTLIATLGKRLNSTVDGLQRGRRAHTRRACSRLLGGSPSTAPFRRGAELPEVEQVTISARTVHVAAPEDEGAVGGADEDDRPAALFGERHLRAAD